MTTNTNPNSKGWAVAPTLKRKDLVSLDIESLEKMVFVLNLPLVSRYYYDKHSNIITKTASRYRLDHIETIAVVSCKKCGYLTHRTSACTASIDGLAKL